MPQLKTTKTKENSSSSDLAIEWLLDELMCAAKDANVHELSEVWNRYCASAEIGKVTILLNQKVDLQRET